jgi:6-phosphogluconate dehydrogenase
MIRFYLKVFRVNVSDNFSILASAMHPSAVGFIGLGNMGKGMAKNLVEKGSRVVAYDTNSTTMAEAIKAGVLEAKSPKEVGILELSVNFLNDFAK